MPTFYDGAAARRKYIQAETIKEVRIGLQKDNFVASGLNHYGMEKFRVVTGDYYHMIREVHHYLDIYESAGKAGLKFSAKVKEWRIKNNVMAEGLV